MQSQQGISPWGNEECYEVESDEGCQSGLVYNLVDNRGNLHRSQHSRCKQMTIYLALLYGSSAKQKIPSQGAAVHCMDP